MFQKVGFINAWPNQKDLGRYEVTKLEADKMVFKVPTLRNVAMTAPYFHDGSVADLDEAIRMMAHHQVGSDISEDEVVAIRRWLGTLTGTAQPIVPPQLPPDGPTTTALLSRARYGRD